jgi:dTDP-4-dehydrorhamnose 3,5-epimerase
MTQKFEFISTSIKDLLICKRKPIEHDLGSFVRTFCSEEFKHAGLQKSVVQINQSLTRAKWSIRGLHFQNPPYAEVKLVTCLKGEVFDVAVDIRFGSATFLHWHGEVLTAENNKSMLIPEGFAHGFQTLTDDCEMLYLHSSPYMPQSEGGFHPNDPSIGINWPFEVTEMSARDKNHILINKDFQGIVV